MYPSRQHPDWNSHSHSHSHPHSPWHGHHYPQGPPPPPQGPPPQRPPPHHYRSYHQHHHSHSSPHEVTPHPPGHHSSAHSSAPPPAYYGGRPAPSSTQARPQYSPASSMPPPAIISPPQHSPVPQTPVSTVSDDRNMITTKPPRPYTEYTMFYQLEREYILHKVLGTEDEENSNNRVALFKNDPLMPARYRDLPLRADWYISGKSKKPTKRKHRKSHGKIGFLELTRMIAARWGKVDTETRKYCKMMAAMELVKYKEDMEAYNQYKEKLSAIGEIPEDMKERANKKKKAAARKEAKKKMESSPKEAESESVDSKESEKKKKRKTVKAEPVTSMTSRQSNIPSEVKLEPLDHEMNGLLGGKLDNEMEEFISSLVQEGAHGHHHEEPWTRSPTDNKRPSESTSANHAKMVTPDRNKRRRLAKKSDDYDDSPMEQPSVAAMEHHELDPVGFEGIDENELVKEFYGGDHRVIGAPPREHHDTLFEPFDYWDALVEPLERKDHL